jgi:hypothetical protein
MFSIPISSPQLWESCLPTPGFKANLFHWTVCIGYLGLSAFITYKFLEKKGSAILQPNIEAPTLGRMSAYGGSKPRPGSMAAADQVANRNFVIGAAIVYILIILAWTVFKTDMHEYYKSAGRVANIAGMGLFAISYLVIFNSHKEVLPAKSGHWYWIGWAVLTVLGLWGAIGFQG